MSLILDEVYYQNLIQGRSVLARKPVVAATTANITLSGPQTIDGVAVIAGNRVLVKNQTDQKQNGIYDVASGSWTRAQDFDTGNASGINVFVSGGTLNGNQLFYCNNYFGSDTIGTHNLTFDVLITSTQSQTLFNESFADDSTLIVDSSDTTKKVRFEASGISTNTTRVLTLPNIDSTLATTNDLGSYVANTELKTKINALPVSELTAINSAINSKVSLTGDESISGTKTFNNSIIVTGTSSSDNLTLTGSTSTGIVLQPYGTASGNTKSIQFRELAANGTHSIGIKAPDSITTYALTLPAAQSAYSTGILQANTSGVMSFDDGSTYVRTTGEQSIGGNKTFTDSITAGNLTVNGTLSLTNITTTGAVSGENLSISGTSSLTGALTAGAVSATSLSVSGTTSLTGSCSASSITASGSVSVGSLSVSGTSSLSGTLTAGAVSAGAVSASSLSVSGTVSSLNLTLSGTSASPSDLVLEPYGTSASETRGIKFRELVASGTEFVGIKAPDSISSSYNLTLPSGIPVNSSSYLISNTNGELSWGIAPQGGGTNGISGDASLTTLAVSGTSSLSGGVTAGNLSVSGTSSLASVSVSGTTSLTGALSAGAITASGSVSAGSLSVSGTSSLTGSCSASSITASGAVSAGSLTVSGTSSLASVTASGSVSAGSLTVSGTSSALSLALSGTTAGTSDLALGPFGTASGNTRSLKFQELAANGTNFVGIKAPDSLAADVTLTLPISNPSTDGSLLSASTAGALSWTNPGSFVDLTTSNQTITAAKSFTGNLTSNKIIVSGTASAIEDAAIVLEPYGTIAQQARSVLFRELAAYGTQYVGLRAPDSIASNYTLSLPNAVSSATAAMMLCNTNGNLSFGNAVSTLSVSGTSSLASVTASGSVSAGSLSVSGTSSLASVSVSGTTSLTGALTAGAVNASSLSVSGTSSLTGSCSASSITASGAISAGNLSVSGTSSLTGALTAGAVNASSLSVSGTSSLTGSCSASSITASGAVSAGSLTISGTSSLASVSVSGTSSLTGALSAGAITASGSVSAGSLSVSGTSSLTGSCSASNITASGSVSAGSLTISGTSSALSLALSGTTAGTSDLALGPFGTDSGNTRSIKFQELAANGTNFVGIKAPDTLSSDVTLTLPSSVSTASAGMLLCNTSGALSFGNDVSTLSVGGTTSLTGTLTAGTINGGSISGSSFTSTDNFTGTRIIVTGTAASADASAVTLTAWGTSASNTREIRFRELAANGTNFVGIRAPDNISTNYRLTFPDAVSSFSDGLLSSDASGNLSYDDATTFVRTTGDQSISGTKTFSAITLTGSGSAAAMNLTNTGTTGYTGLTMTANGNTGVLRSLASGDINLISQATGTQVVIRGGGSGSKTAYFDVTGLGLGGSGPTALLELATDSAKKPNGGSWQSSSDERLKEDITVADLSVCYDTVKNVPLRRYRWKNSSFNDDQINGDRHRLGFIAQEYKSYFPKDVLVSKFQKSHEEVDAKTGESKTVVDFELKDCLSINVDQMLMSSIGAIKKIINETEVRKYSGDPLAKSANITLGTLSHRSNIYNGTVIIPFTAQTLASNEWIEIAPLSEYKNVAFSTATLLDSFGTEVDRDFKIGAVLQSSSLGTGDSVLRVNLLGLGFITKNVNYTLLVNYLIY
jgi:cytoskeletal protein CcmA (bactofilin family)